MKHLRYNIPAAFRAGEKRHPQEVMRECGVTFEKLIIQSMGDDWFLFDCQYVRLPSFIIEMGVDEWPACAYSPWLRRK